jgi:hypothetical protein
MLSGAVGAAIDLPSHAALGRRLAIDRGPEGARLW